MSSVRVNHGGKKSQMCNFASKYKHMLHINRCSKGQRVMNKTICFHRVFFIRGYYRAQRLLPPDMSSLVLPNQHEEVSSLS